jgi:hypothetical protein
MARPLLIPNMATSANSIRSNVAMRRWFNNYVCKNEEKLLERLDQAILDVINNPKKAQKTARIGTLI